MRIVHVHKYFHRRDGASRFARDLMQLQEESGHVVAPFAMHDARNDVTPWAKYFVSPLDTQRIASGFGVARQMSRAWWSHEAYRKMSALLDAFRPDVVHAHNLYTHLSPSPLAACAERGIPVVMHVHDYALVSANYGLWDGVRAVRPGLSFLQTVRTKYIKGSMMATAAMEAIVRAQRGLRMWDRSIGRYIAPSNAVRDALIAVGYAPEKIEVIPHFILPVALRAVQRERCVLFVGRLEAYKGAHVLLDAVRDLHDVEVRIVGVGPLEERLREQARGWKHVRFLGFQTADRVAQLMRQAAVVVVPSVWAEPFGLVAIEALQAGAPVVVSAAGGLPEIVEAGVSGEVVPPGDSTALRAAIERVLANPAYAKSLGEAGERRAEVLGNPQAYLARISNIYSKLK